MWRWIERYRKRQDDLRAGVDADLLRANNKRFKAGIYLLGAGFGLYLLVKEVQLPHWIESVSKWSAALSLIFGLFMLKWAQLESASLNRPEPEDPPHVFKG